jgi:hypothetical protein
MPVFDFDTPQPILATIGLDIGSARLIARDRTRTVVDVRPRDPRDPCDTATAARAHVTFRAGELVVSVPKARGLPGSGAVLLDVTLPTGSRVHAHALAADFHGTGQVGECRITTGCGHIHLARTGPLRLSSVLGNVTVDHVSGDLEATAECGDVSIRRVDGAAEVNRTTGSTRLGEVTGDVRVYADSGDLHIGRAHAAVEARAAQGDIRIDETLRGPLTLETASGRLEVGIPDGAATSLDLDSHVGTVYRALDLLDTTATARPAGQEEVRVHARTIIGDIVVRRATPDQNQP